MLPVTGCAVCATWLWVLPARLPVRLLEPEVPVRVAQVPVGEDRTVRPAVLDATELSASGYPLVHAIAPRIDMAVEPAFQPRAKVGHDVRNRRVVDPVVPLARIAGKVIQLVRTVRIAVHVLPPGGAHHACRAIFVVDHHLAFVAEPVAPQHRRETAPWLRL